MGAVRVIFGIAAYLALILLAVTVIHYFVGGKPGPICNAGPPYDQVCGP